MSEVNTKTNSAFIETVYFVNATEADQADPSLSDSLDEKQSDSTESILTEQPQELAATQEHLRSLFHKLEASHQTVQRQQILIETLTKQLESSQQRLGQLERECFLARQSYNEQSHQLVQTENACRELHTRLSRQQSQTMQFKLALEKCLEVPVLTDKFQVDTKFKSPSADPFPLATTSPAHNSKNAPYPCTLFLSQAKPIPPWSGQPKSLDEEAGKQKSRSGALCPPREEGNEPVLEALPMVCEIFFGDEAVPSESPHTTDLEELHALEQDLVSLLNAVEVPLTGSSAQETTALASPNCHSPAQLSPLLNLSEHVPQNSLESADELMRLDQTQLSGGDACASTELPQQETSWFIPSSNWPSPVIYPSRPPKGRKSLAAIELPTFPAITLSRVAEG